MVDSVVVRMVVAELESVVVTLRETIGMGVLVTTRVVGWVEMMVWS